MRVYLCVILSTPTRWCVSLSLGLLWSRKIYSSMRTHIQQYADKYICSPRTEKKWKCVHANIVREGDEEGTRACQPFNSRSAPICLTRVVHQSPHPHQVSYVWEHFTQHCSLSRSLLKTLRPVYVSCAVLVYSLCLLFIFSRIKKKGRRPKEKKTMSH